MKPNSITNFTKALVFTGLMSMAIGGQAQAITIEDTGETSGGNPGGLPLLKATITNADITESFDLNWSIDTGAGIFSATSTWTINGLTDTNLLLKVDISNTTSVGGAGELINAGIASLGFGVTPSATGVSYASVGSPFDMVNLDTNPSLPGFVINICAFAGNNCAGGSQNDLLAAGSSDSFILDIAGSFGDGNDGQMVMLDSFGLKTQTNIDSYELPGTPGEECEPDDPICNPGGDPIPEPSTVVLFGSGMAGMGLWRWRNKSGKQKS